MKGRVVLAMSGGVDSSVAALLLREQGYEVIGLFMRTGVNGDPECEVPPHGGTPTHKKGCCSSLDAADARRVADRLDIPFYALDFEKDFGRIMDYFVDEYSQGRTPNPCVMCNNWLKFGKLWSYGKQLDANHVATGHYARILGGPHGRELHMARDPNKDQSYVLFGVNQKLLDRMIFPMGDFQKEEIRDMARDAGLPVFNKPDSQEICFVPDGDYAKFIHQRRPELDTSGELVDTQGNVVAQHGGIEHFTVGQRKGLNYAAGQRKYVLEIVPESRQVVIGDRSQLQSKSLTAREVNWLIDPSSLQSPVSSLIKIRYRSEPVPGRVFALPDGRARAEFDTAQFAVTPGQAAVFYDGTRVLGGGWIEMGDGGRDGFPR